MNDVFSQHNAQTTEPMEKALRALFPLNEHPPVRQQEIMEAHPLSFKVEIWQIKNSIPFQAVSVACSLQRINSDLAHSKMRLRTAGNTHRLQNGNQH